MDLPRPLQPLLGKTESRIVVALERLVGRMTGRQIAAVLLSPSPSHVLTKLKKLEKIGILSSEAVGNSKLYEINREHLLWPSIETMLQSRDTLNRRIEHLILNSAIPDSSVWVFGSTARYQSTAESDLDLVLLVPDSASDDEMSEVHTELSLCGKLWTGNETNVYSLTQSDLRYRISIADPLIDFWLKEAKPIIGLSAKEILEPILEQNSQTSDHR